MTDQAKIASLEKQLANAEKIIEIKKEMVDLSLNYIKKLQAMIESTF